MEAKIRKSPLTQLAPPLFPAEAALQGLAERMGVTLSRKEDKIGKKCKPNDPCPCGSGKKFKKCCGAN